MAAEVRAYSPGGGGGGDASVVTFSEPTPSSTWTIHHNLGHYPAGVTVRLLSGEIVEPDRDDTDLNTTVLSFITAAAGVATLV